jgi:hypothetical protein
MTVEGVMGILIVGVGPDSFEFRSVSLRPRFSSGEDRCATVYLSVSGHLRGNAVQVMFYLCI